MFSIIYTDGKTPSNTIKNTKGLLKDMKKEKTRNFPCPSCGNDLIETKRSLIKCPFCETIIIPQNLKMKREAEIFDRKKNEDLKKAQ